MIQLTSLLVLLKTSNWFLLLILACHCRPNFQNNLVLANRLSHRTRLLDTDQFYKDSNHQTRPKISFQPHNIHHPYQSSSSSSSSYHHPNYNDDNDFAPPPSTSGLYHSDIGRHNILNQSPPGSSPSASSSQSDYSRYHYTIANSNTNSNNNNNNNNNELSMINNNNDDDDDFNNHNDVCMAPDSRFGTCYEASICTERGGIPMGRCGSKSGFVCCLFEITCSQTIRERHVYFRNPSFPYPYDGQRICRAKILKLDVGSICQLKLGFDQFDIAKPIEGNCSQDSFLISGQNENNIVPRICGYNTGQHYYIGVDESGMVTLHMVFRGNYQRKFDIHIEQIECGSRKSAPAHCLQYYEGTQGTIKSFNYDSNDEMLNNRHDPITNLINEGYPNNVDYMICIRKETGFCSISYEFMSDPSGAVLPFSVGLSPPSPPTASNQFSKRTGTIQNTMDNFGSGGGGSDRWLTIGSPFASTTTKQQIYSTIQTTHCDDDYLIVSGTKVCTKIVDPGQLDPDYNGDGSSNNNFNNKESSSSLPSSSSSSIHHFHPTERPQSSIEDLITPGNISENIPVSPPSTLQHYPTNNKLARKVNDNNNDNNNNNDGIGIEEERSSSSDQREYEVLKRYNRQTSGTDHHHQQQQQQQQELFQDILTRRFRWMLSAPMLMKKDSFKHLQQNYLMATDYTPGPFQLRFVSNSVNNAKGFYLAYRQNPCKM